jgi:ParB/RepB/Spo0J family partition protein
MTTVQTVKLSQLIPDPIINSRLSGYEDELKQLADNIQSIGLILPLSVRTAGKEIYTIIDGHRRHQALRMVYSGKEEETDVPVLVRDADNADARVLSLAANIMRLPLHPADQFEAFKAMLDEGIEREKIASRFSLSLKDVDQRLALGRVGKPFLNAYRDELITLDTIEDLSALSSQRQVDIYNIIVDQGGMERVNDYKIRNLINDKAIFENNSVVKFVGLDAYEAEGGRVERSLFDDTVRLIDTDLLYKLAEAAVPGWIERMRAEGWMFAMREPDMPKKWEKWERHYAAPVLSDEAALRRQEIEARLDEIDEIDMDELDEDASEALWEEGATLRDELGEITRGAPMSYTDEEKAESCCVLLEDWRVTYGLIWPKKQEKPEEGAAPEKPEVKGWSQALIDELESHGTKAAQLALMREHDLADCMLLTTLYMDATPTSTSKPFAFNATDRFCDTQINAGAEIGQALKSFGIKGSAFDTVLPVIMGMEGEERARLRAVLTARIMKKRHGKELDEMFKRLSTADVMATWKPEKEFFERLTTAQLEEVHKELTGKGFNTPTTKASAVAMVVTQASARNWMPKLLRAGMSSLDSVKLEHNAAKAKAPKGKTTTIVGEDGKTERKRKAA